MATLGVFRDDYYDPGSILPATKYTTTSQASGTLAGSSLAGGFTTVVLSSGATALTLDTGANILAALNSALSQEIGGNSAPSFIPYITSLPNSSYVLRVINSNAGTLTLTGGTGSTIVGTNTLATGTWREYAVTVTGVTTVSLQNIGAGTV